MPKRCGIDVGTFNIICARMKDKEIEIKKEVNAFFTILLENKYMLNLIKKSGAPVIEVEDKAYVLGENAIELALSMGQEYQRPMRNGILSVNEKDAFNILAVIIRSMIGKIEEDGTIVYYSVPADAINTKTNVNYHTKVIQAILEKYKDEGKSIRPYPINEAQAIVLAELEKEQFTGCAISFGAGMSNLAYSMFGVPVVKFSLTNSGDWIDEEAAKHCGETIAYINSEKKNIDLSAEPKNAVERAIQYHYEIMIEQALKGIAKGISDAGTKANPGKPVNIVVAGGTASPKGFVDFFKETMKKVKFPIEIGEVRLAQDHLYSVAKGCLIASENHTD